MNQQYAIKLLKKAKSCFDNSINFYKKIEANQGVSDAITLSLEEPLYPQLRRLMENLQILKYPVSHFRAEKIMVETSGNITSVLYIKKINNQELDTEQLQLIGYYSLLIRKLSLAHTLSQYAAQHLTVEQATQINIDLKKLINEHLADKLTLKENVSISHETKEFITKLATVLMQNTELPLDKSCRIIKKYERLVVSEDNKGLVIINESHINGTSLIQMDIPLKDTLTKKQKKEYVRLHSTEKPYWFNNLSTEVQGWYKKHIPIDVDNHQGWEGFALMNKTSAMQQSLGLKNARQNYLFFNQQVISNSTKIATLSPIEMPQKEQKRLTKLNAEELIEHLLQSAEADFRAHWGITDNNDYCIQPLIFIQSLLSPLPGNLGDAKIIVHQRNALKKIADEYEQAGKCTVVQGNDAVNILRTFDNTKKNWTHTRQLIALAENLLENLEPMRLGEKQQENMKLIKMIIDELQTLRLSPTIKGRNKACFKVALQGLLIEAMGCKVSSNCKSGKDRTGLDEVYRNTMRIYFKQYGTLPSYSDKQVERHNFIAIFKHFFNTMKIQESAGNNTPGSFGIKDSAKMLCSDIAKSLGAAYKSSTERANLNKTTENIFKNLFQKTKQFLFKTISAIVNLVTKKSPKTPYSSSSETNRKSYSIEKIYLLWKTKNKNYIVERFSTLPHFKTLDQKMQAYIKKPCSQELLNVGPALKNFLKNTSPSEKKMLEPLQDIQQLIAKICMEKIESKRRLTSKPSVLKKQMKQSACSIVSKPSVP